MKSIGRWLACAVMAFGAFTASMGLAEAQQKRINVLIMSDDADQDTVPRGNRIFNRVQLALSVNLNTKGFQVYDETAVGLSPATPNRVRRADTELIEVARALPVPLDVMEVFQIYASAREGLYCSGILRPEMRIPGRVLNVHTGQFIGSFEVGGFQFPPLPLNCAQDRECLLERMGAEARVIANDLGEAIAQKIKAFTPGGVGAGGGAVLETTKDGTPVTAAAPSADGCTNIPTAYVISLRDFNPSETTSVEDMITKFGCYVGHRPIRATSTSAEYWYETTADSGRVNRNLRVMLDFLGLNGQIVFNGNKFELTRVTTR